MLGIQRRLWRRRARGGAREALVYLVAGVATFAGGLAFFWLRQPSAGTPDAGVAAVRPPPASAPAPSPTKAAAGRPLAPTVKPPSPPPAPKAGIRATAELRDGSRIVGTLGLEALSVRSVLGVLKVPLGLVQAVEMLDDGRTGRVLLPDGDLLVGAVEAESLELQALVGRISIQRKDLLRLAIHLEPPVQPVAKTGQAENLALVELRDGSRLTGTFGFAAFPFRTLDARLTIALEQVRELTLQEDRETVQVVLENGDRLSGAVDLAKFELQTRLGTLAVPSGEVQRIFFDPARRLCKALAPCLVHGKEPNTGARTDFVKDVPDEIAQTLQRVTRTADTTGSVPSRHDTAPWLYPVPGEGEAPRILVEGDNIYFPIWGTWRRQLANGWAVFDENGQQLNTGEYHLPHYQSEVQYFVVTSPVERAADVEPF